MDAWGQLVSTDNTTFVTVGPALSLSGATSVQVVNGEATFDQLQLRIRPNATVDLVFATSIVLPFLARDMARGLLGLQLRSAGLANGLVVQSNSSFSQLSSCIATCTITLPAPPGAHSAQLELTFSTDQFVSDTDQFVVTAAMASGTRVVQTYTAQSLLSDSSSRALLGGLQRSAANPSSGTSSGEFVRVLVSLPSASVTLSLTTSDDVFHLLNRAPSHGDSFSHLEGYPSCWCSVPRSCLCATVTRPSFVQHQSFSARSCSRCSHSFPSRQSFSLCSQMSIQMRSASLGYGLVDCQSSGCCPFC